jgi:hypothetical protein
MSSRSALPPPFGNAADEMDSASVQKYYNGVGTSGKVSYYVGGIGGLNKLADHIAKL